MKAAKRVGVEVLGWVLLVGGIAAIPLPGPGWLMVFGGLAILSEQYEWAERRLAPVKYRALKGAAASVATKLSLAFTILGILWLFAMAALWIVGPDQPDWWFLPDWLWLPGGITTGATLAASGVIVIVLTVYSYRRFHGKPDAVAELEQDIEEADEEFSQRD